MSGPFKNNRKRESGELSLDALERVTGGGKANLKGAEKQLGHIIVGGLSFAGGALAGAGAAVFSGAVNAPANPHQL